MVPMTADIDLNYKGRLIRLTDVLCADQLKCNLLPIKRLEAKGFQVEFRKGSGYIYRGDELIIQTQPGSNLYNIIFDKPLQIVDNWASLALTGDPGIWHRRLGHACAVRPGVCRICIEAKTSKQPHTGTRPKARYILDKIHVDLP